MKAITVFTNVQYEIRGAAYNRKTLPQAIAASLFAIMLLMAVFIYPVPVNGQTTETITMISGNGAIGQRDPANRFTLDGGTTWQDAYIISPYNPVFGLIPGTKYLNRSPDYSGTCYTSARYRTFFVLPLNYADPAFSVAVHADNVATIFLNGVQIGQQYFAEYGPNFTDPPESFSTTNLSLFHAGMNTVDLDIYNFCGPTSFDYKATATFTGCDNNLYGLVSWWTGDDDTFDYGGFNTGSLVGGVTYAQGKSGKAFRFDGTGRIEVADSDGLNITGPISLDAWVTFTSVKNYTPGGSGAPIVAKWGDTSHGTAGYGLFVDAGGYPYFEISSTGADAVILKSSTPLTPDAFMHVAGVWTGTQAQLYVDGELKASAAFSGPIHANNVPLFIGGYDGAYSAGADSLIGMVDEIEVYNRALSADEVSRIYYRGGAGVCKILPSEQAFTNVRLLETVPTKDIEVVLSSATKAPYSVTSSGETTVIEWRLGNFRDQNVSFDLILNNLISGENRLIEQSSVLIYNDRNNQEITVDLTPLSVHVLNSAFSSTIRTDKPSYQVNENAVFGATISNIGEYARTIDAKVLIEDIAGNIVAEAANLGTDTLNPPHEPPFLSGWSKRLRIAIDHTKITSALTEFPVRIHLSTASGINMTDISAVFKELGSHWGKIAVVPNGGETQYYVEISRWDSSAREGDLWVKVPSISAVEDTILYLYYDSSQSDNVAFVGGTGSIAAKNVWDANFKAVYHLEDDPSGVGPQINDSTVNDNYGTSQGGMNSSNLVDGKVSKGLSFNGSSNRIEIADKSSLDFTSALTIEANVKILTNYGGGSTWKSILSKGADSGQNRLWQMQIYDPGGCGKQFYGMVRKSSSDAVVFVGGCFTWSVNTWYNVVLIYDKAVGKLKLFKDGVQLGSTVANSEDIPISSKNASLGSGWWANSWVDNSNVVLDEVRFSSVARSDAWIKATNENLKENLITFGNPESINDIDPLSTWTYNFIWNTGSTYAGDYRAHLVLHENGQQVGEAVTNFAILPTKAVGVNVTADKISYQANERAFIASQIRNSSPNYIFSDVTTRITIVNSRGTSIYSEQKTVPTLTQGQLVELKTYWNTAASPMGSYTVRLEVLEGATVLNTTTTAFEIKGTSTSEDGAGLVGAITVQPNPVEKGNDETLSYSVSNRGNADLSNVNVKVLIVTPDTGEIIRTFESMHDIPIGSTITGGSIQQTSTMAFGTYLAILQASIPTMTELKSLGSSAFTVNDVTPPVLTVSTISDGSWTNTPLLNVAGTVTDNGGIQQLTINDTAIPVNPDGSFSWPVTLQDGSNVITVVATDIANNHISDTRTIYLDRNAPVITITTPADNIKTKQSPIDIKGTVDESSTVSIAVNGADQGPVVMEGNSFSLSGTLTYETNTIEVTATDLVGNISTAKRTVTFDDRSPSLSVTYPAEDIITNQAEMLIKGETTDLTAISLTITMDENTYTPVLKDGRFEQSITFTEEKTYQINVTAVDEVGNESTVLRNVVYDTTPPSVTLDPVTTPTNSNTQTLTGTVEAGAAVTVTCPTAIVGEIVYPTPATWTAALSDILEGINAITVSATDDAGNIGQLPPADITVDLTPPNVSVTSPISEGTYRTTVQIAATVTDATSGVNSVQYQLDNGAWVSLPLADPATGTYGTVWNPGISDQGAHTINIKTADNAGNVSQPVPVNFTIQIDNTPPVTTIHTGDPVYIRADKTYVTSSTVFTLSATDDISGVAKTEYSIDGGQPVSYAPVTISGEGDHTINFRSVDNAGNIEAFNTYAVTVDNTPPTGMIAINNNEGYAGASGVSLSISASDGMGSGMAKMCVSNMTSCLAWEDYSQTKTWTLSQGDGGKTLNVWFQDNLGNTDTAPYAASITLDTTAPMLIVSTLSDGSWTNNELLNVSGQASDDTGIGQLTINNTAVSINSDGTFSWPVTLEDGPNTIITTATDLAGNQASDARTITLDQDAPIITITSPVDNMVTKQSPIDVAGTVDDPSTVTVKVNTTTPISANMNGNDFTLQIVPQYGINTIEVTATDLANNTSTAKRTLIFDNLNPSLSVTYPAQDLKTNQADMTIQGEASDVTAVTVTITMDGNTYTPVVTDGKFEQPVTFTTEKTYHIYVTAVNEVGSETIVQRNVVYDTTAPLITLDPVTSPTTLNRQALTGTMEAGATVSVFCPTATVSAITYPTATTWTASLSDMREGNNEITVTATDDAANSSNLTATIVVESFTFPAFGVFVIGDKNAAVGSQVTFWGSQWGKRNTMSGGPANASFKGFADITSNNPPSCGGTWTASPGNSSAPPGTIPAYMAVIVSSNVAKSGSTVSGNIKEIVIVKTASGYQPAPGYPGTGTVVGVLCR